MSNPQLLPECLMHFATHEFVRGEEEWWSRTSPRLLVLLDLFREHWSAPVVISPHHRAIGRHDGTSQHNVERWGEVRAVDIMPDGLDDRRHEAVTLARRVGFTGIGLYPDWQPSAGLHLDVRIDRVPGNPAMWGGVRRDGRQVLVSIEDAMAWNGNRREL